ncbi:MAG: winged helix-turn-helix domain-containing protein [Acidobacteriota bacterium]|nr:MAG: winged helix-turn-helix domain-containing protein [Acidobacteriota bacterium]
METPQTVRYRFGSYVLDTQKRLLFEGPGNAVPLMPKAYATLEYLVINAGKEITKSKLMEAVWGDTVVEENNLNQCISAVRKALGEKRGENRFIATIPGVGYEFVSEVTLEVPSPAQSGRSDPGSGTARRRSISPARLLVAVAALSVLVAAVFFASVYYGGESAVAKPPASLAILPFRSLDTSRTDEALELGMTDALISRLRSGLDLPVQSFSSVRKYRSADVEAAAAGRELGVDAVLDGSVLSTEERVRVSVRLVRSDNGKQIWFGKFDEDLGDIFAVQDSIAERVAAALERRLKPGNRARALQDPEAYRQYLRGRYLNFRPTLPNALKSIEYYEKAIEIDPGFVPAYAGLADAYRSLVLTGDYPPRETMDRALAAAEKAVELDPGSSEAQSSLGFVKFWYLWDWEDAELHFKKALDADGTNVLGRAFYAHFLSNMGRHSEALAEIRRAKDIDPRNPLVNSIEGQILFYAGDLRLAKEQIEETIGLEGNVFLGYLVMAKTLDEMGDHSGAAGYSRKAYDLSGGNAEALGRAVYALAKAGKRREAEAARKELRDLSRSKYVPPFVLAIADMGFGDRQKAMADLEKAYEEKNLQLVFLKVDPKFKDLHNEPRFVELLRRMRLE